jgi:hypothetical protein
MRTPRLLLAAGFAALIALLSPIVHAAAPESAEQWGIFELELRGPSDGNPFLDVAVSATFTDGSRAVAVDGFYDGEGVYRVRFMPETVGAWRYETKSNVPALAGQRGAFAVTPAAAGNHGPVRVANTYHFAHADGAPYRELGTTCYSWTHRPEALEERTLRTLAASPFNKLRMCVFPQSHGTKTMPPPRLPFAGAPDAPDYARFNPEFFRHLEKRVGELRGLGIECDLILFHPYADHDEWKLKHMPPEVEERYLRYIVARLAAYRNVWWSLANEYDFIATRPRRSGTATSRPCRPPIRTGTCVRSTTASGSTTTTSRGSRTRASRTARPSSTPAAPSCTATCTASRSCTTRSSMREIATAVGRS